MKSLKINYAARLNNIEMKDAAVFFELNNVFEYIDMLNWPKLFPYKPSCQFKIARSDKSIFIHFKIIENHIRAIYSNDHDPVWEDSCVEFFCKLPEQDSYFNFEFNCIGTCLAAKRKSRTEDIVPFTKEQLGSIERFASLGNSTFNEKVGNFEWKLTVKIPFETIGIEAYHLPEKMMANFYKCADGTSVPHYLSWSHILSDQPDFHRPDFFGNLIFEA